ncbi:MAG: ABC transporter permease/substrate-binding protein [Phaeodactylibacter sp.]|nr:ABC transporter permease/substrate-binding protein [Phaeodactylibacter sp.]MCB9300629.1 ABC transporter permease/substrate-binding protein [Lewinellaceae bacterium]
MEQLSAFWQFLADNRSKLLELLLEHIGLTFLSLVLAAVVAIPLGIYITRHKRLAGAVLGIAGILQTIPSIALLGFMIPLLGIGLKPAIFALFLYALLPIIRNTYTGIEEVDVSVREAALGIGLTGRQILRQVELPLALPVIFAGLRTATVINVGVAALAAYIGAGGLGEFIFGGIALNNSVMILAGAIPAALLAVIFDQLLGLLQHSRLGNAGKMGRVALILIPLLSSSYFWPQAYGPGWKAGFDPEFIGRPDGYPHLVDTYGLSFNTTILSSALMYKAVERGEVDFIGGYSTDDRIKAYELAMLEDDRHAFPPYFCIPLVGEVVAREHPEVVDAVNLLAGRISDSVMTELNYRVDFDKVSPEVVAREFLQSLQLWRPDRAQGGERLAIGSKIFTEQYILVELFSQLINGYTDLDTDLKPGLGGTKICFDALRAGEIALYPEYTGTGLLVLLSPPQDTIQQVITEPDAVYHYVQRELAAQYGVKCLAPLGFNNTYALMARKEMAQRLGLEKISQLAGFSGQ